jgi:hypothetical protein
MRRLAAFLTVSLGTTGVASAYAEGGVAGLVNAKVETRVSTAGLEREARTLLATRPGPFWMGYAVPAQGKPTMCCWSSTDEVGGCGGCRLEGETGKGGFAVQRKEPLPLEGPPRLRILLRGEDGKVERLRMVSEDCALDAGGLPFVWIDGVRPADSTAYLAGLVGAEVGGRKPGKRRDDAALAAIAYTDDPSADAALERFVAQGQPEERRKQAAFWMGQARRARGLEVLSRLVRADPSPRFREHVIFALSQSREPAAVDRIVDVARRDEDGHVRGQALFWLAQTASRRAAPAIETALEDDPEVEVKKKAVFALSQLPKDEGVPLLIRLARTHKNVEVRKQAMFWLGQSHDARALAFFEDVLKP